MVFSRLLVQIETLNGSGGYRAASGEGMKDMRELEIERVEAGKVRRTLAQAGDIRGDVEFQNDVNALLARVEHLQMPWRSLSDLNPAPLTSAIVADNTPLPVARPGARALAGIGRLAPLVVASRPLAPVSAARRR
jgi:hypothetical protein